MAKFFIKHRYLKVVRQIEREAPRYARMSTDELRAEVGVFRRALAGELLELTSRVEDLRAALTGEYQYNILKREETLARIDKLNAKIYAREEKELRKLLPRAYALLREVMVRYSREDAMVVTATQADRELAAHNYPGVPVMGETLAKYPVEWQVRKDTIRWSMVPYRVQLLAAVSLGYGHAIEMGNGEGKTLVAVFPAFLNSLAGRKTHVVTANEYLATRDEEWMGPLLRFMGCSVASLDHYRPHSRRRVAAHEAAVVYGSSNEFVFDYLRNSIATSKDGIHPVSFDLAIVDEVDAVLGRDGDDPPHVRAAVPRELVGRSGKERLEARR